MTLEIMAAVTERELAAQQAGSLHQTLARAHAGNSVVRQFEVDPPEDY